MMKALLINPPKFNMITTNVPALLDKEEEFGYLPPIGLLYVAAAVECLPGCEVTFIDAVVEKLDYQALELKIKGTNPDVVGIHALTFTLVDVLETAKIVKKVSPHAHVSIGGPHATIYPEETIAFDIIDSVVLGEGEYIFRDLLMALSQKSDFSQIKGLVFKQDGRIVNTGRRDFIENLDELNYPGRHLSPISKYWSLLLGFLPATTVISSRGCPYRCIFCDRPQLGKKFRFRSAKNIVDELTESVDMGIKRFVFYDDTFTINRPRVFDICDEIIERKLKISWDIRARVDNVNLEMLEKLKSAGCIGIHFGVESGNEQVLKTLKKDISLEQVRQAFKAAKKAGLKILGYFMLGNPHETKAQMLDTIRFAERLNPDYVHISLMTPFPATEIYNAGLREGVLKGDYWKEFAKNPRRDFVPPLWEENLSRNDLIKMLRYAYKAFYRRPGYIFGQLLNVGSLSDLRKKIKLGINLLRM